MCIYSAQLSMSYMEKRYKNKSITISSRCTWVAHSVMKLKKPVIWVRTQIKNFFFCFDVPILRLP